MITPRAPRITLIAVSVAAIWLALDCSAALQARLSRDDLQARLSARAAEAARLQRALERQARRIARLQLRLARQQLEIETCSAVAPFDDGRRATAVVAYRDPSSSLVVLSQVDDRVEVAPGGPMAPLAQ